MKNLILASGSPRRKQILTDAGFHPQVFPLDTDESFPASMDVAQVPAYLAGKKMYEAVRMVADKEAVIITADTVVVLHNEIIGKPEGEADAQRILAKLSGATHTVITAVQLYNNGAYRDIQTSTRVSMLPLTAKEIAHYVERYKPLDKAGAYAIQEWIGLNKIAGIEGDYYNVVGFPMSRVYPVLKEWLLEETD
jgi:septum formation protein